MSARCRSCDAPMEWVTSPAGGKLPLDPAAVVDREPRPLDVVLHVQSLRTMIVSRTALASGDVGRWLERGDCELRTSHWETCPGAVNHRAGGVNPQQERLGL